VSTHELTLDQIGTVSRGRSRHRPRDAAFLYGGLFPFIQTGDVKRAGLCLTEYEQTYSEAGLAQSKLWPAGTLCITIAANIAETSILGIDACFPDSVIGFIADNEKADTRFVKYLFDAVLKMQFRSFTQGAAQDNLSQEKLLSIKFPVPELVVQKRIAEILSSYDELIENNRRRIALLEEVARMLYREWFVRFRFPGHEHVKIIDGLPVGWERCNVGDVLELCYGKALKEETRIDGPFPVYGSSGIVGSHQAPFVSGPTIIVGRKGNVGSIYWTPIDFWPIDTVYFIPKEQADFWLYLALPSVGFQNTDGGVPGLNRDFAYSRKITRPSERMRRLFNESVEPMFAQRTTLTNYNLKLAKARDLLLPRLMNGELAV
jgi:type I restriction enzyme S subunit